MKSCNCAESAKLRADLAASNARADAAERRLSRFSADGHHLCEEAESLLTAERAETERLRSTVRVLCLEIDALRAARDSSARARGEPAEDVSALRAETGRLRTLLARFRGPADDLADAVKRCKEVDAELGIEPAPAADDLNARVLTAEQRTMFGVAAQRADRRHLPLPDAAQAALRRMIREASEYSAGLVARQLRLPVTAIVSGAAGARMTWEARRAVLRALSDASTLPPEPRGEL